MSSRCAPGVASGCVGWVVWSLGRAGRRRRRGGSASVSTERSFGPGGAGAAPERCVVRGIDARCGTFVVLENRTKPNGRTIGLSVIVLPAASQPARKDAITYLAGGPGNAATEQAATWRQWTALNTNRDILLVDERGTGRSNPHSGDVTRYGTRMAMDDLDAVRAALGYRQLDVIGSSYGATAAQVYPETPSRLRPHARPRGRNRDRRPLLRPVRDQRRARPRPARRGSAPRSPTAARRSQTGSASSASW